MTSVPNLDVLKTLYTEMPLLSKPMDVLMPQYIMGVGVEAIMAGANSEFYTAELRLPSSFHRARVLVVIKCQRNRGNMARHTHETAILAKFTHKNIVKQYGIVDLPNIGLSIVLEYHSNGDINHFLRTRPLFNVARQLEQIASGMTYLHYHGIVHGDMRGSKIMVKDDYTICIVGFANSEDLTDPIGIEYQGNGRWRAPEQLRPNDNGDVLAIRSTRESDVYSVGMTMLEIVTGAKPYKDIRHDTQAIIKIMRGVLPPRPSNPSIADDIWTIILDCINHNPAARPLVGTVRDLLKNCAQIYKGNPPILHGPLPEVQGAETQPGRIVHYVLANSPGGIQNLNNAESRTISTAQMEVRPGVPSVASHTLPKPSLRLRSSTFPFDTTTRPRKTTAASPSGTTSRGDILFDNPIPLVAALCLL